MTKDEMIELFNIHHDLCLKDSPSPDDLHAFNLLHSILPFKHRVISGAEHDEIFLNVDLDELAKVITEEQLITLIRCGVMLYESEDYLGMFR